MRKGDDGETGKTGEIKTFLVATNVAVSRPTGTPTARAKMFVVSEASKPSAGGRWLRPAGRQAGRCQLLTRAPHIEFSKLFFPIKFTIQGYILSPQDVQGVS